MSDVGFFVSGSLLVAIVGGVVTGCEELLGLYRAEPLPEKFH